MPKSSTLMVPESVTKMLSGLRSRWTMPCSCAQSSARSTGTMSSTARVDGSFWPFSIELGERLALQVLEHHVRRAVVLADLVDDDDVLVLQRAVARASTRKRWVSSGWFDCRNLIATRRPSRRSRARIDGAHAALADHLDHLVLVDADAGVRHRRHRMHASRVAFEVRIAIRVAVPLVRLAADRRSLRAASRTRLSRERRVRRDRCRRRLWHRRRCRPATAQRCSA